MFSSKELETTQVPSTWGVSKKTADEDAAFQQRTGYLLVWVGNTLFSQRKHTLAEEQA